MIFYVFPVIDHVIIEILGDEPSGVHLNLLFFFCEIVPLNLYKRHA